MSWQYKGDCCIYIFLNFTPLPECCMECPYCGSVPWSSRGPDFSLLTRYLCSLSSFSWPHPLLRTLHVTNRGRPGTERSGWRRHVSPSVAVCARAVPCGRHDTPHCPRAQLLCRQMSRERMAPNVFPERVHPAHMLPSAVTAEIALHVRAESGASFLNISPPRRKEHSWGPLEHGFSALFVQCDIYIIFELN